MKLPTLYKKTSTGAIEQWRIWVEGATIHTEHGQVDGKMTGGADTVKAGKNLGKKNATTAEEQARSEAQAKWAKKLERNGYVESLERAQAGETDCAGGIPPMLALEYEKGKRHLQFPVKIQRKFNGQRVIAVYDAKTGRVTLWTRKREQIVVGLPHFIEALEKHLHGVKEDVVLDGEAYLHGLSLEEIARFVRQKTTPKPGYEAIEYHVYDMPSYSGTNDQRDNARMLLLAGCQKPVVRVETLEAGSMDEVMGFHDQWVQDGYEGAILRKPGALYRPGHRGPDCMKLKVFDTTEFLVVGVKEGRGKFEGMAIFVCNTADGKEFDCTAPGTHERKRELLQEGPKSFGKKLTVKHFKWTDKGLPYIPTAEALRDYE